MTGGFGVEWEHPDGHRHISPGYTLLGASRIVRVGLKSTWSPRPVRVMQQTPEGWKPFEVAA